ncbi:MAG TPA: hypothetical protein VND93_09845, partial [Myxococcales bacterium]|nr:hypothetical protein [Myxococcales bacterium]
MYCVACREERSSGARWCAACGAKLQSRPKERVEADLKHVRFLLGELERWDSTRVPAEARTYLAQRYQRLERVLVEVLEGAAPAATERAVSAEKSRAAAERALAMLTRAAASEARAAADGAAAEAASATPPVTSAHVIAAASAPPPPVTSAHVNVAS